MTHCVYTFRMWYIRVKGGNAQGRPFILWPPLYVYYLSNDTRWVFSVRFQLYNVFLKLPIDILWESTGQGPYSSNDRSAWRIKRVFIDLRQVIKMIQLRVLRAVCSMGGHIESPDIYKWSPCPMFSVICIGLSMWRCVPRCNASHFGFRPIFSLHLTWTAVRSTVAHIALLVPINLGPCNAFQTIKTSLLVSLTFFKKHIYRKFSECRNFGVLNLCHKNLVYSIKDVERREGWCMPWWAAGGRAEHL